MPLVVRAMIGRGWGQGPQHSKAMYGAFAHFPGLKIVCPATPQDAYSLLRAAIRDDNPVLFFEHRWLFDVVGEVDEELISPLGTCALRRSGRDLTIVACSWMVVEAMQAAAILAKHGIEAEVIDVRSVVPLDTEGIIAESVRGTGRVIIADNDWSFCGLAAELAARITQECWPYLKAAPERLGFAHVPCPTARPLETLFYPSAQHIVRAAEQILGLDRIDLSEETFNSYETRWKGPF